MPCIENCTPRDARTPCLSHKALARARGVGALRSARLARAREWSRARRATARTLGTRALLGMRTARCACTYNAGARASGCASRLDLRANSFEILYCSLSRAATARASPLPLAQDRDFRDDLSFR